MQCIGIAVLLSFILTLRGATTFRHKVCIGSPLYRWNAESYQKMKDIYTNCTYVDGNLKIIGLRDDELDLSFLNDIREVAGYVVLYSISVRKLSLPNLMVIHGRTLTGLMWQEGFSAVIIETSFEILELPALREISSGKVKFWDNRKLCYIQTIKWEEIIEDINTTPQGFQYLPSPENCPPCHESCIDGCWGPGPLNCQKFSKTNCSDLCDGGRCFGPNEHQCCHSFCAGGCTGPTQRDCFACKNFNDNGVCKRECPLLWRYNLATYSWERNPEGKYAYGALCVKECPEHLLRDIGACVDICPDTKKAVNGECVPCGDGPCPRGVVFNNEVL